MTTDFDLIVIGGGAAGLVAAGLSAALGARTALIERNRLGGECTWTGCVPSKSLLKAASVAHTMRTAARFGIEAVNPAVDFARVMRGVRQIQETLYEEADAPPRMERLGVKVIPGEARFVDPHTVEVRGTRLSARFFVIAAGSRPVVPRIDGLDSVPYLTNESLFELTELPRRLLIVGAGPIGIEMAQTFQRLGSRVTVVDSGHRVLGTRRSGTVLPARGRAGGGRCRVRLRSPGGAGRAKVSDAVGWQDDRDGRDPACRRPLRRRHVD